VQRIAAVATSADGGDARPKLDWGSAVPTSSARLAWLPAAVVLTLIALATLSAKTVDAVLIVLTVWALRSRLAALQALELSVIVKYMNPALTSYDALSGVLMWLVILVAAGRVAVQAAPSHWRRLLPVLVYVAIAGLLSLIASAAVDISVMKLITFTMIVCTIMLGMQGLSPTEHQAMGSWLLTVGLVVIALSALTLLQPMVAFFLNGSGLQGILNHPQSLGSFIAPFAALLLSRLILQRRSIGFLSLVLAAMTWTVIFMTEARTAAFAATLGVMAAVASRLWWGRKRRGDASTGRVAFMVGGMCLALLTALIATDRVGSAVTGFLLKRSGEQQVGAALHTSRGAGIESQWRNFLDAPITGHGFGVYPDGRFPAGISRVFGIPISAPVEKGFVPSAVLEESGVLGGLAFAWMIGSLAAAVWRGQDPLRMALFASALGVNAGEAVLLAPAGIGLHIWMVIAVACSLDGIRISRKVSAAPRVAIAPPAGRMRFPNVMR
jgi:hypothetical protein